MAACLVFMTINSLICNFSEDHKSIENVLCGFCSSHINRTYDISSLQFPFKELNKTFILKEQNKNKTKTWKEYNRIFQSLLLQAKSILGRIPLHQSRTKFEIVCDTVLVLGLKETVAIFFFFSSDCSGHMKTNTQNKQQRLP